MTVLIAKLDVRASMYPRKFGSHVTVPPSAQQETNIKSHFLASLGDCNLIKHIHVVVS